MNYLEIINLLPDPVYWADENSVLIGCNQAEAELFGLKVEEAVGKNMHHFAEMLGWDRKVADVLRKNDLKIMETGRAQYIEETSLSLDGKTKRIFLSHKAPFYNDSGRIIGIIGTSMEITQVKKPEFTFTKRERECVAYFLLGETIRSTAKRLCISPRTVETHLENIKNKLNCHKKSELIAKLIEYGFRPGIM